MENIRYPRYLNEKEVADMTGFSLSTLRNNRFLSKGIPYIKVGKSVRYDLKEVVAFMERHRIQMEVFVE
ncbi:MAG TPA: DNA-binding protein [bacterium]|nr:DNA-binding protein [bacterium]